MLNNLLTFILLIVSLILNSCSQQQKLESKPIAKHYYVKSLTPSCPSSRHHNFTINEVEKRLSSSDFFQPCLKNFFKINPIKEMLLMGCADVILSSQSEIISVKLTDKVMPESLRWCIEQELWSFNYKLFLLENDSRINLSVNFKWLIIPAP